jgi:hypothetical protein
MEEPIKVHPSRLSNIPQPKIKSQGAAFKQAHKPAKKPKQVVEVKAATPQGVKKNKQRNERRKAARKVAGLLKAQNGVNGEVKEGEENDASVVGDKESAK